MGILMCMNSEDLKNAIKAWANKVGHKEAIKILVIADVSVSMAQQLVSGRYKGHPRYDTALAMKKVLDEQGEGANQAS